MRNKLEKLEKENVELRAQLQSIQSAFTELQFENAALTGLSLFAAENDVSH